MEQATCPHCGLTVPSVDGVLLRHGQARRHRVTWCAGSGEQVAPALPVQLDIWGVDLSGAALAQRVGRFNSA